MIKNRRRNLDLIAYSVGRFVIWPDKALMDGINEIVQDNNDTDREILERYKRV